MFDSIQFRLLIIGLGFNLFLEKGLHIIGAIETGINKHSLLSDFFSLASVFVIRLLEFGVGDHLPRAHRLGGASEGDPITHICLNVRDREIRFRIPVECLYDGCESVCAVGFVFLENTTQLSGWNFQIRNAGHDSDGICGNAHRSGDCN